MSLSMLESYGIIVSLSSWNRPQIFIEKNRAPCSGVCGAASGHRGLMPSSGRSQPHLDSGAGRLPKEPAQSHECSRKDSHTFLLAFLWALNPPLSLAPSEGRGWRVIGNLSISASTWQNSVLGPQVRLNHIRHLSSLGRDYLMASWDSC